MYEIGINYFIWHAAHLSHHEEPSDIVPPSDADTPWSVIFLDSDLCCNQLYFQDKFPSTYFAQGLTRTLCWRLIAMLTQKNIPAATALICVVMLSSCGRNQKSSVASADDPAIYSQDNRMEWYEAQSSPSAQQAARSTLVMFRKNILESSGPSQFTIRSQTLASRYNLCSDQRFREQPSYGTCSGFLVAPNILATAGHCVNSQADCLTKAFALDFMYSAPGQNLTQVEASKVFYCKNLVSRFLDDKGVDYALIELDRDVAGRTPLTLSATPVVSARTPVTLIGYPSGMPLKIAEGAEVLTGFNPSYFLSNVDAFGGNSGSPIINSNTGAVEGILVRGASDYMDRGSCKVARVCTTATCNGEQATRSAIVLAALKAYQTATPDPGPINGQPGQVALPGSHPDGSDGGLSALFQTLNTRLRSCTVSLAADGVKASKDGQGYEFLLDIYSDADQKSEFISVEVDPSKSIGSLALTLLRSIFSGNITRCFLN